MSNRAIRRGNRTSYLVPPAPASPDKPQRAPSKRTASGKPPTLAGASLAPVNQALIDVGVVVDPGGLRTASDSASQALHLLEQAHAYRLELISEADARLLDAVSICRQEGQSWKTIGLALGITAQAAHQRFASPRLDVE